MLTITLPGQEYYDPVKNEFSYAEERVFHLEHSLLSVSKWEARWKKAFMTAEKTEEEMLDYIRCMCAEEPDAASLGRIAAGFSGEIAAYVNDPMTATTFGKTTAPPSRKKVTSEEIYWLMAREGIPFTCETWHLNRLMTLLRICAVRSGGGKKMSKGEVLRRQAEMNRLRRGRSGSDG